MSERPPEVSSTRLYLGNMPPDATKGDIEEHFKEAPGEILDIKLLKDFAFIEYKDPLDARDVVPMMHGSELMGKRIVVQFARGDRDRQRGPNPHFQERPAPRTRRTVYRMTITGLPAETSWQDLKDFARQDGLDVVYSEVARARDGNGFVEYETEQDLNDAVEKTDGREFRGSTVQCAADIQAERPRDRFQRSRSPPSRRGGYGPPRGYDDYYDRRPPPRESYTPRGYRDRSPPPPARGYRDDRYGRSPPPRGRPPMDDYPPPARRGYPDDGYPPPSRSSGGYGPPRPPYDADPYMNGRGGYDRPPSPRRPRSPPRGGYSGGGGGGGGGGGYGGYDRREW